MPRPLDQLIHTIRDRKVILDADLASIYGVPTKALNQAVKRNAERFPEDFAFVLTKSEWRDLRAYMSSKLSADISSKDSCNRSQFVTGSSQIHRDSKITPLAFTEHGALMAANLLKSPEATRMSVFVVRAFVKQRELLMAQADVLKRLSEIDARLLEHDSALRTIWREIQPLLNPPAAPQKPEIGFHVREEPPPYRVKARSAARHPKKP
jgi:hypothetical protein